MNNSQDNNDISELSDTSNDDFPPNKIVKSQRALKNNDEEPSQKSSSMVENDNILQNSQNSKNNIVE